MTDELAKLRWRCRRGMRELDTLLQAFLETDYGGLTAQEKAHFAEILECPDPDLHAYLVGKAEPVDAGLARLVDRIRARGPAPR